MDAGEMLIIPGHEAGRVHSSKAGLDAAVPQSDGLNLFRTEALPKADVSAEAACFLPLSPHVLHNPPPS